MQVLSSQNGKGRLGETNMEILKNINIEKKYTNHEMCIHQLVERQVDMNPDRVAVRFEGQTLTYYQLNVQANRLASFLKERGVVAETPVLVCLERSMEMIVSLLGILKAGGAYVPLDPDAPKERLAYMIKNMQTSFLITTSEKEALFEPFTNELTDKVLIDKNEKWSNYSSENINEVYDNDHLMYIIYTSGSTGHPKGVMNTHKALNNRLQWMQETFALGSNDKVLQKTPYSFDVSVWEFFWPLIAGATLVFARPGGHRDPDYLKEIIQSEDITTIHFVPSMLGIFLDSVTGKESSPLRRVICSGEALTKNHELEFFNKFNETGLFNLYGPTEAAIDVSFWECTGNREESVVPIGFPIANIQLHILNEKNEPVPVGEIGELHIGGVGLARGYYGNEELTNKSFIQSSEIPYGRLYKTGDLCRYREDQSIEYIGRKDFQVKIRGFRIELAEIELTMERQNYIKQCIVTSIQRGRDTHLAAYVTVNQPGFFNESKLRESLTTSLPDYMIPTFIVQMDSFPLSMNGKIDRKNLPDPFTDLKVKEQGSIKTEWERRIASIWEDLLQVQGIGTEVSFLRVGGNSLFAARLVHRIKEELKLNTSLKEIFDYPTIKQQALLAGESNRHIVSFDSRLVNIQEKIPLSDAQKRLWFINKLEGDSPLYNLPHYIEIKGRLNVVALKESVRKVILQHDIFKYRFIEEEGIPYILLDNRDPDEIEIIDLSGLNPEIAKEKACSAMMQDAREAFDFENGPFYRINLYGLSSENFILYFNFHHIISDGWSDDVFRTAVFNHYSAITEGHQAPKEPSIQYQDYILSKEYLNYESSLDYWDLQLPRNTPAIHLHAGSQASRSHEGMEEAFTIAPELVNRLKIYCEENGYTLYMAMLAIYKIFIHRLSLEKDLSVGTPVAGRKSSEQEQLIGFFVNTVVIRDKIHPLDTFGDFLRQVKESTLDAFSHDEVPFEKVVERIKPNRGINETPLFQYMFSFLDIPETSIELKELEVGKASTLHNATSKFDLTLSIEKEHKGYIGKWEYRTECYTEEIVKGFTRMFQNLLHSVIENPEQQIHKLSLLSEMDKDELIRGGNETKVDFPNVCLHELFEEQADKTPENIAAIYEGRTMNYRELEEHSNQLAHLLIQRGVLPDTPVGVRMDRSIELVVVIMGILKAGGAYLPIDKEAPKSRMKTLLESAKAPICFVDEDMGEKGQGLVDFITLDLADEKFSSFLKSKPKCEVSPENLVSVYYTSGSTGTPKGVCSTHQGWVNRMCWMQNKHGMKEKEIALQKTTLTFDDAAVEFFWPLMVGGTIALIPPGAHRDPKMILDYAVKHNVTLLQFVPSMLQMILEEISPIQKAELSNLRIVVSSGESLKRELVSEFYQKMPGKLFNSWGATEVSIDSTCFDCDPQDHSGKDIVSVGRPIDNNRVYILDEYLVPVPYGVPGDLYIAGIGLAQGYLNNPIKTVEAFVEDPFYKDEKMYRTGDRGYIDWDKNIMFLGREDNQVKIRGMRVELGEIESTLRTMKGIKDAVVLTPNKQQLVAYYVTESESLEPQQIKKWLNTVLPEFMVPVYYIRMDSFPLNSNGKVDRKSLPRPNEENLILHTTFSEPKSGFEEKILSIWQTKLCLEQIGTDDDFFELGGHSLLAVQVVSQINKEFKTNLPVRVLFENPTIAGISSLVEVKEETSSYREIKKTLKRGGLYPLSDAQKRIWFLDKLTEEVNYNMPLILKFGGHVDTDRMNKSIGRLISRHEILRTNFIEVEGVAWQKIIPKMDFMLDVVEMDKGELQELIHIQMNTKFNLQEGPLLRGLLVREAEHDTLILTIHHIISDGWSLNILKEELLSFYSGNPAMTMEPPLQYADYSIWKQAGEEEMDKQLSYWKNQLKGDIPSLELPSDNRKDVSIYKDVTLNRSMTPALAKAIKSFSKFHKVTPFMVILSTFNVLLSRLSNQTDIIIGTPIVNRNQDELERAIGLYLNTLPIRSQIRNDETFLQLLFQIRNTVMDAFAYQDVPFERIVEKVQPERNISRNPLFDVMINYRNFAEEVSSHAEELEVVEVEVDEIASKFYMTLYIEEISDGFNLRLSYQNNRYSQDRMEEFLNQYFHLLHQFIDKPDHLISDVSLITEQSRHILPNPETKLERKWFPNVVDEIKKWSDLYPNNVAVEIGNVKYTYRDLLNYSGNIAKGLIKEGLQPGDVVAVHGSRSFEMVGTILAVLQAGGTFFNIDDQVPYNRLESMMRQSKAKAVIFTYIVSDSNQELARQMGIKVMESLHLKHLGKRLGLDELKPDMVLHENAYIFFTSGTTGEPKGILGTHNGLAHFLSWQKNEFDVIPADRSAQLTHVTFDVYLRDIFLPLTSGATLCIPKENVDEMDYLYWIGANGITLLHAVPSLTKLWLARAQSKVENNIRHIFFAGEPLPYQLVKKWRKMTGAQINNFYGQTESTLAKSYHPIKEPAVDSIMSIGKPIIGAQLLLINEKGKLCGVGEQGEIVVRTPYLTKGYLDRGLDTFEKNPFSMYTDDRVYRTGDLGRYNPDGTIDILGRKDEQIKIRGIRIDKNEVTAAILRQPHVSECAVMDTTDVQGEKQLIAFIVSSENNWDSDRMRTSLRNDLTLAMIPSRFVSVKELPVTPNGKIDRKKLLELDSKPSSSGNPTAFKTEWEIGLQVIWKELIQNVEFGVNDNFFELGGHSLMIVRMVAMIKEKWGKEVTLLDVFRTPTIKSLASSIAENDRNSKKPMIRKIDRSKHIHIQK